MYPEFFHIPLLHTYGVLVALAFLVGLWLSARFAREAGLKQEEVTNLGIYCAMAAVIGAKVLYFIVEPPLHISEIFSFNTLRAGGVFYGGLVAALATAFWYIRKAKLPPLRTSDVFAPAVALGHGIGRLGCFAAGCCWGVPTNLPWAVTFRNPAANEITGVPLGVARHPTQLYEAFAEFAIFLILYWRVRRPHRDGAIIGMYLMLYATVRFLVEFVRFHEQGNLWGGPLDTSQWISIGLFAFGAFYCFRAGREACPT